MDTAYLRRQATFCLRMSQLCSDSLVAEYLKFKAAEFHETALRAEFFCRERLPIDGGSVWGHRPYH